MERMRHAGWTLPRRRIGPVRQIGANGDIPTVEGGSTNYRVDGYGSSSGRRKKYFRRRRATC